MQKLPEELWRKIFEYVDGHQLIKLSRVCCHFRDIVNTSPSLAGKLTLCFKKRRQGGRLGKRKYRRLTVNYIDHLFHYNVLRFIGNDITHLTFSFYEFRLDTVRQVLLLCPIVKYLKFDEIPYFHGVNEVNSSAIIPSYRDLDVYVNQCDPRIFKVLRNCQAKKVHVLCLDFIHRHYFTDFVNFLRDQEQLMDLTLEDFNGE